MFKVRIAYCLMAAALVLVAINVDDPYLAPVRSRVGPIVIAVAVAGIVLGCRLRDGKTFAILLSCAAPFGLAVAELRYLDRETIVLNTPQDQALQFGRHFIVGYRNVADIERLAARGLIGGIYVTRHNIAERGTVALRDDIDHLQAIRHSARLPPLIVATDQEGGIVTHLSPPLSAWPALANLADLPADQRREQAMAEGLGMGRELAALGVNVDFAPVIDLRPAGGHRRFDFNTLIEQRAIAADPDVVAQVAVAFGDGLAAAGVLATIKHFPGLGRVSADTHHFRASLNASVAELEASDWRPFRVALAHPNTLLMVGHVAVEALDPDHPASQSKAVIGGLLRMQWGYQGVIVTDDLVMSAVFQHGICQGVTDSLNAGVDLLLVAFDGKQFYRLMACVLVANAHHEIDMTMLAASNERLHRLLP